MKKELFKNIITDNQEKLPHREERSLKLPLDSSKIISLVGCRRCGKTSLFYNTIKELRNKFDTNQLVYINFDDDRMEPTSLEDCQLFLDAYYELFPDNKNRTVHFFLDEIQNIENWEKFVRRIYDTENCRIFLTGSSSKLLSREIATNLRGRSVTYTIFPLSFAEYLRFNKVEINVHSSTLNARIKNLLDCYIQTGGFPELFYEKDLQEKILQEYVDMIIYKDLVERYNITNLFLIRHLVKYCLTNISTLVSMNKLFNTLKSQGIKVSKNTLYEYFAILEEAMVIYQVPLYSDSPSIQQRNPKKVYAVDIGLKRAVSFEKDMGHSYENIVFMHLRQHTDKIFYYKGKQEVDFLYFENKQLKLLKVSCDIENMTTKEREVKGLLEAMKQQACYEATIVTQYREELIHDGNYKISIVPLWKWLLRK